MSDPAPSVNEPTDDLSTGPFRTTEAEPMAIEDIRDAIVIRDNGVFLLTDKHGNVPAGNESGFGLYFADTRYLSAYEFSFGAVRPVMLLSTAADGFASEQVLTNPTMTDLRGVDVPRETIEVRRERYIDHAVFERLQLTNFGSEPVQVDVTFRFAADFADIFEVRGMTRARRGVRHHAGVEHDRIRYTYTSLDGLDLACTVAFDRPPERIDARSATFCVALAPEQRTTLGLSLTPSAAQPAQERDSSGRGRRAKAQEYRDWKDGAATFLTGNEIFNAILDRSLNDLRTLWNQDGHGGGFLAAGTPWFDTLFGRDSLVTSMQTLAFRPEIARASLYTLGLLQGTTTDVWRDEQPGKILHEARNCEMARTGEVPFERYYGSIDSTPLYMMAAAEYWRWTGDVEFARWLWPRLLACMAWVRQYGDRDRDGYIEYERMSEKGLLNQGWKDSGNAIVNRDGSLASYPIALVEVQAYVYAGLLGMAEIGEALGERAVARRLRAEARAMRARFNRDFWMPEQGYYAFALDGQKRRVESIASNPGHALFAGIVPRSRGPALARHLLGGPLFSGWGVRTLSADSPRFNPMGYHIGSVWPHDNSLIAAGLKRYGQEGALIDLMTAFYDCARAMDYFRLPELFCGVERAAGGEPVPYPVACRPQAWAAGTFPLLLTALLGLEADAPAGRLVVMRPRVPYWLDFVDVTNLRVGGGSVDLHFSVRKRRTQVRVRNARGIRVQVVDAPDEV
ncbi:MAG TPA: glycogen debranching N-terminal domain-containing protein [Dehalococcoidia bacterium]|jgi:glycogen debranching enzyme|nr:glycogen debranching N-terminal domain-containing protein [Dehalococcoidia bacterium]